MSVESKIIEVSKEQIKALAPRAAKAMKTPDTGVKILNNGAYFVIRDCATVTTKYLPIMLYGKFKDSVKDLYGKFTKKEISSLVERGKKKSESKQLASLMVSDAMIVKPLQKEVAPVIIPDERVVDDVYGDYGDYDSETPVESEKTTLDNDDDTINYLCDVFGAV